jgi:hypothetical protein
MIDWDRQRKDPASFLNRALRGFGALVIAIGLTGGLRDRLPANVPIGLALAGVWLVAFLVLEVVRPRREKSGPAANVSGRDDRPGEAEGLPPDQPDQRIDIVPLRDVVAEPNPEDGRYARFVAWSGDDPTCESAGSGPVAVGTRSRRDPSLRGRVAVASFFIGRDGTKWTDREIAQAHRALERAGRWVEAEATRWQARVNIDVLGAYFAAEDPETTEVEIGYDGAGGGGEDALYEAHAVTSAIASASRAASCLSSPDFIEMATKVERRVDCDHLVWLLHPRRAGQSIAVPPSLTPIPGIHLAVCFARETKFSEPLGKGTPPFPDPVTYVHELLHLFGATDKYDRPLSAFDPADVSAHEVMALHVTALPRLRVDRLTAREIGWLS